MTDLDKIIRAISEIPLTAEDIAARTGYNKSAVSDALLFMVRRRAEYPDLHSVPGSKAMRWLYAKKEAVQE